jgi:aspartate ammonia-lyase
MRKETDFLGPMEMDENALYGIQSMRAKANFPDTTPFHLEWFIAMGEVKKACYTVAGKYFDELQQKKIALPKSTQKMEGHILKALVQAAEEVADGQHFRFFIVPAISGGAGTSINMNINEIIANRSLQVIGQKPGAYDIIDPVEQANIFQSTNDVVPTALKVAILRLLVRLEEKVNLTRQAFEGLEKEHLKTLRVGYTQMQEAVPTTYGRLFSNYCDAFSRDWWRVSKCFERIKVVNLGGSALGTGITVPQYFIMHVAQELQNITGLPVTRGENLSDITSNLDPFVEVHAILKAHAVNLEKTTSDLRLLSSDLIENRELSIPKKQMGSSIMPGKVNPVVPEFVISCAHKVYANDQLVASLAAQGCLDLNAYIPTIGHAIIESIKLLIACNDTLLENLVEGLLVHAGPAFAKLMKSPSITTALLPLLGYHQCAEMARFMQEKQCDVFEANKHLKLVENDKLKNHLSADRLTRQGFKTKDLME